MKIAIVTYHRAINYGAILQCYALYKKVSDMADEDSMVYVLDYRCKCIEQMRKIVPVHTGLKPFVKGLIRTPFLMGAFRRKVKKYTDFIEENIDLMFVGNNQRKIDAYITGSDQVWNLDITNGDTAYFLDFVGENSKKYSYAASFGNEQQFQKNKKYIMQQLSTYTKMTIREPIGLEEINKELGVNPEIVIDPVFIIDREQWYELADTSMCMDKYILVYLVAPPKYLLDAVDEFSRKTGLPVIVISDSLSMKKKYPQFTFATDAGPSDFLGLFSKAEYVFTTSFHGTAFSILFNKQFFAETESLNGHNFRITRLLELTGLSDHSLDDKTDFSMPEPDWEKVNEIVEKEKEKSEDFISQIFNQQD